jgi:hypothetical protein
MIIFTSLSSLAMGHNHFVTSGFQGPFPRGKAVIA